MSLWKIPCCVAFGRDEVFKTIAQETAFELNEVKALLSEFKKLSRGSNVLTRLHFQTGSKLTDPELVEFTGRIFDQMDKNRKGSLTFKDVASAISFFVRYVHLRRGSIFHRISYTFQVCDWKQQGFLDLDDMKKTIHHSRLLGQIAADSLNEASVNLFSSINTNKDGTITFKEWRNFYAWNIERLDPVVALCEDIIGEIFPTVTVLELLEEHLEGNVGGTSSG